MLTLYYNDSFEKDTPLNLEIVGTRGIYVDLSDVSYYLEDI